MAMSLQAHRLQLPGPVVIGRPKFDPLKGRCAKPRIIPGPATNEQPGLLAR